MQRLALLALLITACGGSEQSDPSDSATSVVPAPAISASPSASASACPATGLWSQCALLDRLERSGLVPRVDSSARVDEPPLSVPGTLVRVGNAELEVYLYPTTAARQSDAARLDSASYLAYGAAVPMQPKPTLIESANFVGIFHSRNDHQRERVGDAITAGPPQPVRP